MTIVATIDTGTATYDICTPGHSYAIAGFCVRDGRGTPQLVRGCRDARAAFGDAKRLARKANKRNPGTYADPALWAFRWV